MKSHKKNLTATSRRLYRLTIFLVGVFFLVQLFYSLQQNNKLYQSEIHALEEAVQTSFSQSLTDLSSRFQLLISHYGNMPSITQAIENNDREFLLSKLQPEFVKMKRLEPDLFVMHLVDPKNTTILRMHKPQSYGDDLTKIRPIMAHVNQTKQQATAFEPGKNGITYRITTPISNQDEKHLGLIEFGLKPTFFANALAERFKIKSRILVNTDALKNLTRIVSFPSLENYTVVHTDPIFDELVIPPKGTQQLITSNGKTYLAISNLALKSYDGKELAHVQVVKDISQFADDHRLELNLYILLNLVFFAFLTLLLYFIFRNYQTDMSDAHQRLAHSEKTKMEYQTSSQMDELTQTYNRRHLNQTLSEAIQTLEENDKLSLIFFDIDHFKDINDNYGHLVGDKVLSEVAQYASHQIRPDDMIFRWGGEEFCILLFNADQTLAAAKGERLRSDIEKRIWSNNISMTISLGVTEIHYQDSLKSVQERADKLMYQAKNSGRNCLVAG